MNLRAFQHLLHTSSLSRKTAPKTKGAFGGTILKGRVRGIAIGKALAFKIRNARIDARLANKVNKLNSFGATN